jgi:glycosyltransferase involved in cell wall biosynthesis
MCGFRLSRIIKMTIDVVIPCRNEETTIGLIVQTFRETPGIGNIIVVDNQCIDNTWEVAEKAGADIYVIPSYVQGKGAAILRGMEWVQTKRVILFDGDVHGINTNHVRALTEPFCGMVLGVLDFTRNVPWAKPDSVSWVNVTGERCLPSWLVRETPLQGYGTEVQLNAAATAAELPVKVVRLEGCRGTARWNPRRYADMGRDHQWLKNHPMP